MIRRVVWALVLLGWVGSAWAAPSVSSDAYRLTIVHASGVVEDLPMTLPDGQAVTLVLTHTLPSREALAKGAGRPLSDAEAEQVLSTMAATLRRTGELIWLEVLQKDPRGMNTVAPVDDTDGLGVDLPRSEQRRMTRQVPLAVGQTARWIMPGGPNDEHRAVILTRLKPSPHP